MPSINPSSEGATLVARYYSNGYYYDNTSPWYSWGRWVLFGCIVVGALVLFFLLACLSSRRRRRRGNTPFYGTGWMANNQASYYGPPQGQAQPQSEFQGYGNQGYGNQGYNNTAPPYSPPGNNASYYGNASGGYGGQQTGIELQQPPHTYQARGGADNLYSPPEGAPPKKGDIIR